MLFAGTNTCHVFLGMGASEVKSALEEVCWGILCSCITLPRLSLTLRKPPSSGFCPVVVRLMEGPFPTSASSLPTTLPCPKTFLWFQLSFSKHLGLVQVDFLPFVVLLGFICDLDRKEVSMIFTFSSRLFALVKFGSVAQLSVLNLLVVEVVFTGLGAFAVKGSCAPSPVGCTIGKLQNSLQAFRHVSGNLSLIPRDVIELFSWVSGVFWRWVLWPKLGSSRPDSRRSCCLGFAQLLSVLIKSAVGFIPGVPVPSPSGAVACCYFPTEKTRSSVKSISSPWAEEEPELRPKGNVTAGKRQLGLWNMS